MQLGKLAEENEWLKQQNENIRQEFNQRLDELMKAVGVQYLPDGTLKLPKVVIESSK